MQVNDAGRKKALLLYYSGEGIQDILETLTPAGDGNEYDQAIRALKGYFEPQKCVDQYVFEFRKETQHKEEDVATYATRLTLLADKCEFANKDTEIRRQIVQGCISSRLRRKALESDLTLDGLLKIARAMEQANLRINHSVQEEVKAVGPRDRSKKALQNSHSTQNRQTSSQKCYFCGRAYPHEGVCPAKGKDCKKCGKSNHFAVVCRSSQAKDEKDSKEKKEKKKKPKKNLNQIRNDEDEDTEEYNFCISASSSRKNMMVEVFVNDIKTSMLVDTGCHRNLIDKNTYLKLFESQPLSPTKIKLFPYGSKIPLDVAGKFSAMIRQQKKAVATEIIVVEADHAGNLLSYETAQELDLISTVAQVDDLKSDVLSEYADIFQGIGKMKNFLGKMKNFQVHLHVNADVKPVAQPHRRIPFSLRKKVEEKISELEKKDIIEPIDGPTNWVSPIVCVPKPKNKEAIRMCIDMRAVNKAVERERHIMPTMTEVMAEVSGAKWFSKLDLNDGYHQLELDEESRNMTVFSTHLGLRRFKRLSFGINSASEIFQNAISQAISGIKGTLNLSDDILLFSEGNQQEHTHLIRQVLQRLREKGLTLNRHKCSFLKTSIESAGHIFTNND